MNYLFDQIQLMRGDFARVDGKMADFGNKISAVQDNVSNLKSEIIVSGSWSFVQIAATWTIFW